MLKRLMAMSMLIMLLMFSVTGCNNPETTGDSDYVEIKDMAGREVRIPQHINKVYATSSVGSIFVYTLAPEKLAGWNSPLRDEEKKYILSEYHNLPVLGRWNGNSNTGNIEELIKVHPDVIISMGDVSPQYIADADAIQKQLDIPVLMVEGSLKNMDQAYRFLGGLLEKEERAGKLADYCTNTWKEIDRWLQNIPENDRVRIYYAEGPAGLETERKGTVNSEAIDLAGGLNVANPNESENIRRMQVSLEQLLLWDPQVIIISTDGDRHHEVYNSITNSSKWKNLQAVQNQQVYEIPNAPYDWINRPPSVMRLLGVKWLAGILYPDYYSIDLEKDMKQFYKDFLFYNLSDQEAKLIIQKAR